MIRLGIDLWGGDQAPQAQLAGAHEALPELAEGVELVLIGPADWRSQWPELSKKCAWLEASQRISMDAPAVQTIQQSPQSSLVVGMQALASAKIQALATSGHSGAVLVAARQILGLTPGISRPVIAVPLPRMGRPPFWLMDAGLNQDARPEQLLEWAYLAQDKLPSFENRDALHIGLLNTGKEPGKGARLYRQAYPLLQNAPGLNFWGNVEARNLFSHNLDLLLCDGFTGNIAIKTAEALHDVGLYYHQTNPVLERLDYEKFGGTPLLGVKGSVVLGHGSHGARGIKNLILAAQSVALSQLRP